MEHRELGEGPLLLGVFTTLEGAREAVLGRIDGEGCSISGSVSGRWIENYILDDHSISIREIKLDQLY